MVIYIYGSESFKKDIHAVLNHSNIKFRLDEHGEIKDLKNLNELKDAIEDNPNNIYLIDDEKIIKKNSLNKKIKFLQPKDGIEQEYLLDHGIGDISVDSIDELSTHIKKRLEAIIDEKESSEIQESIVEMVEDAYEQDETKEYIQLDDELSQLLSKDSSRDDEINEENNIEERKIDLKEDHILDDVVSLVDDIEKIDEEDFSLLKGLSFDEDLDNINTQEEIIEHKTQGDNYMADDFSQFDTLDENEILAALDSMESISASSASTLKEKTPSISKPIHNNENVEVNGSNVNDIAQLISQLLNNKTLEITIKVKD